MSVRLPRVPWPMRQIRKEMKQMSKYNVNMVDSDERPAWFGLATDIKVGNQDSGRCQFTITTGRPQEMETAMDNDDDVLFYALV